MNCVKLFLFFIFTAHPSFSQADCDTCLFNGEKKFYLKSGKLWRIAHFKEGVLDGKSEFFYSNGDLRESKIYEKGICVKILQNRDSVREKKDMQELARNDSEVNYDWSMKGSFRNKSEYRNVVYKAYCNENRALLPGNCLRTLQLDCMGHVKWDALSCKKKYMIANTTKSYHFGQLISENVSVYAPFVVDSGRCVYSSYLKDWQVQESFALGNGYLQDTFRITSAVRNITYYEGGSPREIEYMVSSAFWYFYRIKQFYSGEGILEQEYEYRQDTSYCSKILLWRFYEKGKLVRKEEISPDVNKVVMYLEGQPGVKRWVRVPYDPVKKNPNYQQIKREGNDSEETPEDISSLFDYKNTAYASGHFEGAQFITDTIVNAKGEVVVKNGNGYYEGDAWPVTPCYAMQEDTMHHPPGYGYIIYVEPKLPERFVTDYWAGGESFYPMIPLEFQQASGRFENGLKTGKWEYEHNETKYGTGVKKISEKKRARFGVLSGSYSEGKRKGAWKYKTEYYKITLEYGNSGSAFTKIKMLKDPIITKDGYDRNRLYISTATYENDLPHGTMLFYDQYPVESYLSFRFWHGSRLWMRE